MSQRDTKVSPPVGYHEPTDNLQSRVSAPVHPFPIACPWGRCRVTVAYEGWHCSSAGELVGCSNPETALLFWVRGRKVKGKEASLPAGMIIARPGLVRAWSEGSSQNWDPDTVTLDEAIYPEFAVIIYITNKINKKTLTNKQTTPQKTPKTKKVSSQVFEGF